MKISHRAITLGLSIIIFAAYDARAQGRDAGGGICAANVYNCADTPNPLPAPNTVWIEEMTWMDVRDALKAGKTTAIISTGGIEPNGPWLATGKHNYVLRANCDAIARKLGNALCAPIVKLVPEGNIEPPSSHMVSPNTLSLRENSFRAMLSDIVQSLKVQGFKMIFLIGDSGGNQGGMQWVADSVTKIWNGNPIVAFIPEYYDYASVARHLSTRGVTEGRSDALHDDPEITLNMFITDPASVRYDQRVKAGLATINGFSIADRIKTMELAREVVRFRTDTTISAINRAIAAKGTVPRTGRGGRGGAGGDSAAAGGRGGRGGDSTAAGRGGRGGGRGGRGGDSTAAAGRGGGGGGGRGGATQAPGMRAGAGWGNAAVRPDSLMSMGGGTCGPGAAAAGRGGDSTTGRGGGGNPYNCAGTKNPVPELNTVWMEELTWMGVRDFLKAGKGTMIVPVGGIEPGGPWLTLGHRNAMLKANCDAIARRLGDALCAPIIDVTPAGNIEPPSGHMTSPGTLSLREDTFKAVLQDVLHGLKVHGFRNLVVLSDVAGADKAIRSVVDTLSKAWKGPKPTRVVYISEYAAQPTATLRTAGVTKPGVSDGLRDDPETTLQAMIADPNAARWADRVRTRQATINGVSIADLGRSLQLGKQVVDARVVRTVTQIRQRTAAGQ